MQLFRLLHLASPALPIGAFHFSQGLEYAVEAGWVRDEATAREWIGGLAENSLGKLDLPVMLRLRRDWMQKDEVGARTWNRFLLASRETEELRAEDRHMGLALSRVLRECGVDDASNASADEPPAYATMFACACAHWAIPEPDMLRAYAWTWVENQTLAAIKLVPLGQSAGQRILHAQIPRLSEIVARADRIADEDIGASAVMQSFASARHEGQYTRLFKS